MKREFTNIFNRMFSRNGKKKLLISLVGLSLVAVFWSFAGINASGREQKLFDQGKVTSAIVTRAKGFGFFVTAIDVEYVVDGTRRDSDFYSVSLFENYRKGMEVKIRYLPENVHTIVSDVPRWKRSILYLIWFSLPTFWFVFIGWSLMYAYFKEKQRLAEISKSGEATDPASTP